MPSTSKEANLILALRALQNDKDLSVRAAAKIYNVNRTTLAQRRAGWPSRRNIPANSRKLTNLEEKTIVRYTASDDDSVDPSIQGNNLGTLLGESQASDKPKDKATVRLVMGLTITPPPPHLSDDLIPKFNLVQDTKETVQKAKYLCQDTADEALAPKPQPTSDEPESKENPAIPGNPDDERKESGKGKSWKDGI
ncbi:hypothetical protein B0T25DRAFT_563300 [Lasiosphaeria hispida]|uniref:HTH psq-type domain-containing protein n=1 Tax=Lasiosphaeria hispida TaxID=260671 RepID=A0AAJ0HWN0_9PEZI|nr:hypothetical protein B0T25DRAFT_563300 [Lasiosphaeria hispida]